VKAETESQPPPFIAFYSFKGGVGRSMALINAACILAGHGRRVLAIDLDLEAPGISYLLQRERPRSKPAKGFVDFIYDLLSRGEQSPLARGKKSRALLSYTAELPLPETLHKVAGGSLRIMPAGRIDADYEKRRQAIDLHRLYIEQKGEPIIRHLRNLIIESNAFDYVLIDSRTGFADEAGISVRDLADHLVVLHGLNHQNIEGTARFLSRFKRRVPNAKKMKLAFVASPIPLGEDDLCERRMLHAAKCFTTALGRPVKLNFQIPYHPRLALDESPFIFRRTQGALHHAYGRIEDQVRAFNGDTVPEWSNRFQKHLEDDRPEDAFYCIRKLGTLNEDHAKWLARRAVVEKKGTDAFDTYWDFFVSLVGRNVSSLSMAIDHYKQPEQNGTQQKDRLEKLDRVEKLYREMLPKVSKDADKLDEIARFLWQERKNAHEAARLFRKALEVSPANPRIICNYAQFEEEQSKGSERPARLYKRAVTADPEYVRGYMLLGRLLEERQKKYAAAEVQYRYAVQHAPKDAASKARLAWFLAKRGKKLGEAERLMRQSVEHDQGNPNVIGNLATFLWRRVGNNSEARELYQRALTLNRRHANNAANFAGFLLANAGLNEAEKQILAAWDIAHIETEDSQIAAEVAFYRCLCLRLQNKVDAKPLAYLKRLFTVGYERGDWWFDEVLRKLDGKLPAEDIQFYTALSKAILDEKKVERLNDFDQWTKLKPISLGKDI
jgi:Tfp pilus assembly protein PilF/cellulose biosynthesis protein BcsQ